MYFKKIFMNILASVLVFVSVASCIIIRFFDKKFFIIHALFGVLLVVYGSFELYSLLSMKTSIIARLRDSLHLNVNWYVLFYLFIIYTGISQLFRRRFKQQSQQHWNKYGWKHVSFVQHCSDLVHDIFSHHAKIDLKDVVLKNREKMCVHVTFGSAIILIPADFLIEVQAESKMGHINVPHREKDVVLPENQNKIILHLRAVCGSITVKYI